MTATDTDCAALARKAAGNWRQFQCFAWWVKPEDPENWAVFYTRNRDSGLLDVSNHHAIATALDKYDVGDDPTVFWQDHSHFAVGWVTAAVIRVYGKNGRVTKAFKVWCDLQQRKDDYPILDETDYSDREYEAVLDNIHFEGKRLVGDNPPEDWPGQVFEWLAQNNDRELENRDDQGAYPSREAITAALDALRLLDDDEPEQGP